MIFPVRCFTCSKVIGGMWDKYVQLRDKYGDSSEAFDELDIKLYCCRRMFLGHVDTILDNVLRYPLGSSLPDARRHHDKPRTKKTHVIILQ